MKFQIDQCLHGYRDGHGELSSSIKHFSSRDKRLLLVLSDMSGSSMAPKFEEYLTAYSLPDSEFFAFAKTWYAPEMDRPGCVWTHTLLLNKETVSGIHHLQSLESFFRRPEVNNTIGFEGYSQQLFIDDNPRSRFCNEVEVSEENMNTDLHRRILLELFAPKKAAPVVVQAFSSEEFRNFALSLWSLLWPELRFTFAFCTGSLSYRRLNGKEFDLQIVPTSHSRSIRRDCPDAKIVERDSIPGYLGQTTWLDSLQDGVCNILRQESPFVDFLRRYGLGGSKTRYMVKHLSEFWTGFIEWQKVKGAPRILRDTLSSLLVDSSVAREVAYHILGIAADSSPTVLTSELRMELLEGLLTEACDTEIVAKVSFEPLATFLMESTRSETIHLAAKLISRNLNTFGEKFLDAVAKLAESSDLLKVSEFSRSLGLVFSRQNPVVLARPEVWNLDKRYLKELLQHASDGNYLTSQAKDQIVHCVLADRQIDNFSLLFDQFGESIVDVSLNYVNENTAAHPEGISELLVKRASAAVLAWLAEHTPCSKILTAVVREIDPTAQISVRFGLQNWHRIWLAGKDKLSTRDLAILAEFMLPIGLRENSSESDDIVQWCFSYVHDELAKDSLSYREWMRISPLLPNVPWYKSWDKCERLRLAMRRRGLSGKRV